MAYELSWVIPSRVFLIKLGDVVPNTEIMQLIGECHAYVDEGQSPVHILIDATEMVNKQVNLQELSQLSKSMPHDGMGWWVLINPAKMVWFTTNILSALLKAKFKSARSIEEAITILERVDFTLDAQITLSAP